MNQSTAADYTTFTVLPDSPNPLTGSDEAAISGGLGHLRQLGLEDLRLIHGLIPGGLAPVPTNVAAAPDTNAIRLSWASVPNAQFYALYRSRSSGGPYIRTATTTVSAYTDLNVSAGIIYYYVVRSCDGMSLSGNSAEVNASPVAGSSSGSLLAQATPTPISTTATPTILLASSNNTVTPQSSTSLNPLSSLKAPTSLRATAGKSCVTLSFAASSGAQSYTIYRSTNRGGPYSPIGASTTHRYIDTAVKSHTKYYYLVRASAGDLTSTNSVQASAIPR